MSQANIRSISNEARNRLRSDIQISTITQCAAELVFNSLDAKSTAIAVRLNMITLRVQVVDNGEGITLNNMENVGTRYMTSKYYLSEDFDRKPKTYGCKGESLASIIMISGKVQIVSKSEGSDTHLKTFSNGNEEPIIKIKDRPSRGTAVTVEDFLYNCPVRRNRINKLEIDYVKKLLEHLTVIFPNVSFSLRNDETGDIIYNSHKEKSVSHVLCALNPTLDIKNFSEIKVVKDNVRITGLFYMTSTSITNMQHFFVNKFPVSFDHLRKLIKKCLYRRLDDIFLSESAHPVYVVNINCPYSEVNVYFDSSKYVAEFKSLYTIERCIQKIVKLYVKKYNKQCEKSTQRNDKILNEENMFEGTDVNKNAFGVNSENAERNIVDTNINLIQERNPLPEDPEFRIFGEDNSPEMDINKATSDFVCLANVRKYDKVQFEPLNGFDANCKLMLPKLSTENLKLVQHDENEGKKIIMETFIRSLPGSQEVNDECQNYAGINNNIEQACTTSGNKSPSKTNPENNADDSIKDISFCIRQHNDITRKRRLVRLNSVGTHLIEKKIKLQNTTDQQKGPVGNLTEEQNNFPKSPDGKTMESQQDKHNDILAQLLNKMLEQKIVVEAPKRYVTVGTSPLVAHRSAACQTENNPTQNKFQTLQKSNKDKKLPPTKHMQKVTSPCCFLNENCNETKNNINDGLIFNQDNSISNKNKKLPPTKHMKKVTSPFCLLNNICDETKDNINDGLIFNQDNSILNKNKKLPPTKHMKPVKYQFCFLNENYGEITDNMNDGLIFNQDDSPLKKSNFNFWNEYKEGENNFYHCKVNKPILQENVEISRKKYTHKADNNTRKREVRPKNKNKHNLQTQFLNEFVDYGKKKLSLKKGKRKKKREIDESDVFKNIHDNNNTFNSHFFQLTPTKKTAQPVKECKINHLPMNKYDIKKSTTKGINTENKFNDLNNEMKKIEQSYEDMNTSKYFSNTLRNKPSKHIKQFSINNNNTTMYPTRKNTKVVEVNTENLLSNLTLQIKFIQKHNSSLKSKTYIQAAHEIKNNKQGNKQEISESVEELNTSKYFNRMTPNCKQSTPKKIYNERKSIVLDSSTFNFQTPNTFNRAAHTLFEAEPSISESAITFSHFHPKTKSTQKEEKKLNFFESFLFESDPIADSFKIDGKHQEENIINKGDDFVSNLFDCDQPNPKGENLFSLKKRLQFVPKGLSPIFKETKVLNVTLSPTSKKNLNNVIIKSFEEELQLVKWTDYINKSDPKEFFDKIYTEKQKMIEKTIPSIDTPFKIPNENKLPQTATFNKEIFTSIEIIGQLDNKFIVAVSESRLLLFDQHAVHERIRLECLYEEYIVKNNVHHPKFKSASCNKHIKIPFPEFALHFLETYKHLFDDIGFEYEVHKSHIFITRIPQCLYKRNIQNQPDEVLCNFIKSLLSEEINILQETRGVRSSIPRLLQYVMSTEACRGAIKFGHQLSNADCEKYIKMLLKCNLPFQCAHGRPTLFPVLTLSPLTENVSKVNLKKLLTYSL